jgi:iron complex transport system substrate-binding protein
MILRGAPRRGGLRVVLVALAFVLAGCGERTNAPAGGSSAGAGRFPLMLTDDEGVRVTLKAAPQRIVTFAPADTETVFALGLGNRLVGVSYHAFDNFPPQAASLPEIGGANTAPNIERVESLQPDLMLATAGGQEWKQRLRDLGVPVFTTNATSFDDALRDIRTIGRITGADQQAARLTMQMASGAEALRAKLATAPAVSCFLDLGGLYTVAPQDFVYDLLVRAGCDPVTAGARSSYPQWSKDQLVQEDPAVFLFTSDSGDSIAQLRHDSALRTVAAIRDGKAFSVDSNLISRPGPRLVEGLMALVRVLHPGVAG